MSCCLGQAIRPLQHSADGPILFGDKFSEAGLGHLMDPIDPQPDTANKAWIADYWLWRIREFLALDTVEPTWMERPAIGSHTISSPRLHAAFATTNDGVDYADSVKPFSFMLIAFLD